MAKPILLSLALLLPLVAQGEGLPGSYPSTVMRQGEINLIDQSQSLIWINDQVFAYTSETNIHYPNGKKGNRFDLRPGQRVGCDFAGNGRPRVLTDIWVVPDGASFEE